MFFGVRGGVEPSKMRRGTQPQIQFVFSRKNGCTQTEREEHSRSSRDKTHRRPNTNTFSLAVVDVGSVVCWGGERVSQLHRHFLPRQPTTPLSLYIQSNYNRDDHRRFISFSRNFSLYPLFGLAVSAAKVCVRKRSGLCGTMTPSRTPSDLPFLLQFALNKATLHNLDNLFALMGCKKLVLIQTNVFCAINTFIFSYTLSFNAFGILRPRPPDLLNKIRPNSTSLSSWGVIQFDY